MNEINKNLEDLRLCTVRYNMFKELTEIHIGFIKKHIQNIKMLRFIHYCNTNKYIYIPEIDDINYD